MIPSEAFHGLKEGEGYQINILTKVSSPTLPTFLTHLGCDEGTDDDPKPFQMTGCGCDLSSKPTIHTIVLGCH